MPDTLTPIAEAPPQGLIVRTAQRYGVEPAKLLATLKPHGLQDRKAGE